MLVNVLIAALALPALAWGAYLAALALLSGENAAPPYPQPPRLKLDVVVPAHDEEAGIASTVASLLAVDYPRDLYRVIVVADNCADATAARASQAGATVFVRDDAARRGKGYALAFAFERSLSEGAADAIVVVDADTRVTPNLLHAVAARVAAGAKAVQVEYAVANPKASWRTRLMHIAFTLFHDVRSRARERLGASAGLRGNGMGFASAVLREVPHDAFSVVEDVEYGIRLGRAGHRVHYAGEARVSGEMVAGERASRSQRRRWEGGRATLARRHGAALLLEGMRRRSLLLFDLGADLVVPPLTYVACATAAGVAGSAAWMLVGHGAWWSFAPWAAALIGLALYVARGVWLAGVGPRAVLDLMWAPLYMIWKMALAVRALGTRERDWVRTAREGEKP
ncbi:MAG TPA: glycosyltransferase family 2 protein [Polyangiaceae bacterium]|nr:glycosyltransferase family 2 protein [Polyangiaceae bacterium]